MPEYLRRYGAISSSRVSDSSAEIDPNFQHENIQMRLDHKVFIFVSCKKVHLQYMQLMQSLAKSCVLLKIRCAHSQSSNLPAGARATTNTCPAGRRGGRRDSKDGCEVASRLRRASTRRRRRQRATRAAREGRARARSECERAPPGPPGCTKGGGAVSPHPDARPASGCAREGGGAL